VAVIKVEGNHGVDKGKGETGYRGSLFEEKLRGKNVIIIRVNGRHYF